MQAGLGSPPGSAAPRGRAGHGDGQGRSAPASPLAASAAVPCQGRGSCWLRNGHRPGKGRGHRTPRCRSSGKGCTRVVRGTCPFSPSPPRGDRGHPGGTAPAQGRARGYHRCCGREVPRDGDAPIPFLQALSALCHPPHQPLPFWGHPLHPLPSRGTLCAELCPVPPCSQQRVGVWRLHHAGARGIPWGRDTARGLPCSQPGLRPAVAQGSYPWRCGAQVHGSAGLGPTVAPGSDPRRHKAQTHGGTGLGPAVARGSDPRRRRAPVRGWVPGRFLASHWHPWAGMG